MWERYGVNPGKDLNTTLVMVNRFYQITVDKPMFVFKYNSCYG
ncbi:MAG: hypothetical protein ACRC57_01750 [Sarcina sp.]